MFVVSIYFEKTFSSCLWCVEPDLWVRRWKLPPKGLVQLFNPCQCQMSQTNHCQCLSSVHLASENVSLFEGLSNKIAHWDHNVLFSIQKPCHVNHNQPQRSRKMVIMTIWHENNGANMTSRMCVNFRAKWPRQKEHELFFSIKTIPVW